MSDIPQRTIDFLSGYWNVDHPIKEFCAKMELELIKVEKERDEAREALKALAPLTYHDCYFYKDMTGNCMVCIMEETK